MSEEALEIFRSKTAELEIEESEEDSVETRCYDIKKNIKIKKWKLGQKKWWDRSCGNKKRKVKSAYRKWKFGTESKERYLGERREWRELCKTKEKEQKDYEEEELRQISNESDV